MFAVTLLLKIIIVPLVALLYYIVIIGGVKLLDRAIPDSKLKRFLFRERGRYDA